MTKIDTCIGIIVLPTKTFRMLFLFGSTFSLTVIVSIISWQFSQVLCHSTCLRDLVSDWSRGNSQSFYKNLSVTHSCIFPRLFVYRIVVTRYTVRILYPIQNFKVSIIPQRTKIRGYRMEDEKSYRVSSVDTPSLLSVVD